MSYLQYFDISSSELSLSPIVRCISKWQGQDLQQIPCPTSHLFLRRYRLDVLFYVKLIDPLESVNWPTHVMYNFPKQTSMSWGLGAKVQFQSKHTIELEKMPFLKKMSLDYTRKHETCWETKHKIHIYLQPYSFWVMFFHRKHYSKNF